MIKIVIAIDGFSSTGKSTMAKDLAKKIGYTYIDTGAMYRAVTLYCLRKGYISDKGIEKDRLKKELQEIDIKLKFNSATGRPDTFLNDENVEDLIRKMDVSNNVSLVATLNFVRKDMVRRQQDMGKQKGVVMDGRDIGTVVFPKAELKIFVTATAEIRAQRRFEELKQKGEKITFEEVLKNVENRDYMDSHRKESPLRQAEDAILLDNSNLTVAQQDAWLLEQYNRTIKKYDC